jgi:triosephosphate isomerase
MSAQVTRKFFVGGNWKCNGTKQSIQELCEAFNTGKNIDANQVEVVVAPPSPYAMLTRSILRQDFGVALQNCWVGKPGAFTGEVAAEMIRDIGLDYVILGHSERRHLPEIKESDDVVARKTKYAIDKGLTVILCIGELLEEREAGRTKEVNERQLSAVKAHLDVPDWSKVVIAYEPVWAIGTGKVATAAQAQEAHAEIRSWLRRQVGETCASQTRILYGGSVTPENCHELAAQPDVDGFLVGGASLKPTFLDIVRAHQAKATAPV